MIRDAQNVDYTGISNVSYAMKSAIDCGEGFATLPAPAGPMTITPNLLIFQDNCWISQNPMQCDLFRCWRFGRIGWQPGIGGTKTRLEPKSLEGKVA